MWIIIHTDKQRFKYRIRKTSETVFRDIEFASVMSTWSASSGLNATQQPHTPCTKITHYVLF